MNRLLAASLVVLVGLTLTTSAQSVEAQPDTVDVASPEAATEFNKGQNYVKAYDLVSAEASFRRVVAISPDFAPAYLTLGTTLVKQGKTTEAIDIFSQATNLKPVIPILYLNLGTALHEVGRIPEAIESYKKLVEIDPTGPYAPYCKDMIKRMQSHIDTTAPRPLNNGADNYLGDATKNGVTRWAADAMPIKIFINVRKDVPGYRPAYSEIFKRAVQDWVEAAQGKIKIRYVDNAQSAQITCRWSQDPAEMVSSHEAGNAVTASNSTGFSRVDITLLAINPYTKLPFTDRAALNVAQHEIGHAFGLSEHSVNPADIMYDGFKHGEISETKLSDRDKNTLLALYSLKDSDIPNFSRGAASLHGDDDNPTVLAGKLSYAGLDAIRAGDFAKAVQILEPAHLKYPESQSLQVNLGIAYTNLGTKAMNENSMAKADECFTKGSRLMEGCSDKHLLGLHLKSYLIFLRRMGRSEQIKKAESQLAALSS